MREIKLGDSDESVVKVSNVAFGLICQIVIDDSGNRESTLTNKQLRFLAKAQSTLLQETNFKNLYKLLCQFRTIVVTYLDVLGGE